MPAVYFAPLQGMTTYIYRTAHSRVFSPGIDKYYSPFFMPHEKCNFNFKEIVELGPAENASIHLVPQILTRDAAEVLRYQKVLADMGYDELNINLGCPSRCVTSKGRGSAFLYYREELDRFLDTVYSGSQGKISVKTRVGTESEEEFPWLVEIFNQYPISELIIHPRTMRQFYEGVPIRSAWFYALKYCSCPLVYNGDIWKEEDWRQLLEESDQHAPGRTFELMIGRSAVADPALGRKIQGSGGRAQADEIMDLMHELIERYRPVLRSEEQVLFRLKELWSYMIRLFPDREEALKKLNRSLTIEDYLRYEAEILS